MKHIRILFTIFCLSFVALATVNAASPDDWNKKTKVTFSQPVEIPGGIILPAGTYIFRLFDSATDRHIVQIFNEDQTHIYATILAIPNWRLQTTDKTVMTFGEQEMGSPQPLRAWFYPGANYGEEFVYSRKRATELAASSRTPILATPAEMEPAITMPVNSTTDAPVMALKTAPVTAVKPTGETVEMSEVVTAPPPPVDRMPVDTATAPDQSARVESTRRLPHTAGEMPLYALLGMLSLGFGLAIWAVKRRSRPVKITGSSV
jgi:hypothetical protein